MKNLIKKTLKLEIVLANPLKLKCPETACSGITKNWFNKKFCQVVCNEKGLIKH